MLLFLAASLTQVPNEGPVGTWANPRQSVIIVIATCGDGLFCGKVQWASEKAQADARRGGTTNLIGSELLRNFTPNGAARWRGILFVPDLNKKSKAEILQVDSDHLRVRGCAVGGLLCKSEVWTRADKPDGGAAE